MNRSVYYNGRIIPEAKAGVSVYDGGWLHGAGLFETMRAQNGRIFRLERHVDRLQRSAAQVLRPIDRSELPSREDFFELLECNELRTARVRLTVSAGSVLAGADEPRPPFTVCVIAAPLSLPPAKAYEQGVQVVICGFRQSPQDPIAGHKTTAYLPRLLGLRQAHGVHCMEAIWFTTEHLLAEGCMSNVFVVSQGLLKTPPLDTPVLPGIARATVIELAKTLTIGVEERPMNVHELLDADEVFLTNAIMRVVPVIKIENKDIGNAGPGPITKRLLSAFHELAEKECGGI